MGDNYTNLTPDLEGSASSSITRETRNLTPGSASSSITPKSAHVHLHLGSFKTETEAAEAYDIAVIFLKLTRRTNYHISHYKIDKIQQCPKLKQFFKKNKERLLNQILAD
eukprot:Gb_38029 [translate_table: standard]